ncbi:MULTISPECIES: hypothetical protein [Pectobacterium]|uniref:hypothetical protein n=1 Tax=Pectobacterium TaxID=122277 RepID=UPI0025A02E0F|nr:hypothetical protein [Pectobacterium brasiliense]WJM80332.1 hypothetical protein QTI90_18920 [Pectobacterium brasiliense]
MSLPSPDDWKTTLSVLALMLSIVSFIFTRKSWLQSNRPIVSASVETHSGGNESIAYNLVLSNTGNRPATNVCIRVKEIEVDACISEWVKNHKTTNAIYSNVMRCFSDDGEIPLLLNGKSMVNSFGYTCADEQTFWLYGVSLPVEIKYCDLDGRTYKSKQIIRVKDSEGFAGGVWQSSNNKS